jgi:hypothetical protein
MLDLLISAFFSVLRFILSLIPPLPSTTVFNSLAGVFYQFYYFVDMMLGSELFNFLFDILLFRLTFKVTVGFVIWLYRMIRGS